MTAMLNTQPIRIERTRTMTRYELLQALEMMLPSRDDWFISDEDEGIIKICFSVDPEDNEELELSDYEKGYLKFLYLYESNPHLTRRV